MLSRLAPWTLVLAFGCAGPPLQSSTDVVVWPEPWHARQLYTSGDYTVLATSPRDAEAGVRLIQDVRERLEDHVELPRSPGVLLVYAEHDPVSKVELDLILAHLARGEPIVEREVEEELDLSQAVALKLAGVPLEPALLAAYLDRPELARAEWAMTVPTEAAVKASLSTTMHAQAEAEGVPGAIGALMSLALPFAWRYVRIGVFGRLLLMQLRPELDSDEIDGILEAAG